MITGTQAMATLADVRCTPSFVERLYSCGATGVRINSAHVGPEELTRMVATIRRAAPAMKILMDTKGPEVRTTPPEAPIELIPGMEVALRQGIEPSTAQCLRTPVAICAIGLAPGHRLLVDDGAALLEVTAVGEDEVMCRVARGTTLDAAKTLASPDTAMPDLPAVSARDRENIEAASRAGIDMIAHSFVRSAADVEAVRALIADSPIELYAKIECRAAVCNLDEILRSADALLVARGDLGTQIPLCDIPAVQYRVAQACHLAGKPMMIATQMLESMTSSPTPTRAELSDIALGVMQGARWLLLCGETARGKYPFECVATLKQVIDATQQAGLLCKML